MQLYSVCFHQDLADLLVGASLCCAANPEEIEIGDEDDDDEGGEEEAEGADVQEKAVPAAVFGSLAAQQQQQQPEEEPVGALERFKKRRVE